MEDSTKAILVVLMLIALIVLGPLLLIWSLNTLFGLSIAYNMTTWAAALVLGGVVRGASK